MTRLPSITGIPALTPAQRWVLACVLPTPDHAWDQGIDAWARAAVMATEVVRRIVRDLVAAGILHEDRPARLGRGACVSYRLASAARAEISAPHATLSSGDQDPPPRPETPAQDGGLGKGDYERGILKGGSTKGDSPPAPPIPPSKPQDKNPPNEHSPKTQKHAKAEMRALVGDGGMGGKAGKTQNPGVLTWHARVSKANRASVDWAPAAVLGAAHMAGPNLSAIAEALNEACNDVGREQVREVLQTHIDGVLEANAESPSGLFATRLGDWLGISVGKGAQSGREQRERFERSKKLLALREKERA